MGRPRGHRGWELRQVDIHIGNDSHGITISCYPQSQQAVLIERRGGYPPTQSPPVALDTLLVYLQSLKTKG